MLWQLHAAAAFAPLHTPAVRALIGFSHAHFPGIPQVACFDTQLLSGLLGISGVSGDMRRLHETAVSNRDARLAIEMFCVSVRKPVAVTIAVLGGVDTLVFSGGIGENDAQVRTAICTGLAWTGVSLDESRNRSASNPVSDGASRCEVLVLTSQEDEQIARHAWALLA